MKCSYCDNKAIYFDGNNAYCKKHFIEYFENKVLETIEKYDLIHAGEKVGVAVSGGKDSISLLYLLNKYRRELDIEVVGIHIDEGIRGYRDILTKYLVDISKKIGLEVKIYRFKDYFIDLDEAVKRIKDLKPCTICGVWRRWLMWRASKDLYLDKLATAHNLNDEVQTIIMNVFEGNIKDLVKGGPKVGIVDSGFIPRIKPFYFLTEKETTIYSLLNNINPPWVECPYIYGQTRDIVRARIYRIENKYLGFQKKIITNYMRILKSMKDYYREKFKIELKPCKHCGYPTTRRICRACEIKLKLDK